MKDDTIKAFNGCGRNGKEWEYAESHSRVLNSHCFMIDLAREEIIKDESQASVFCGWMKYSNSNTGKKLKSLVGNI